MRFCICKSIDKKGIDCPLSWYGRPVLSPRISPSHVENAESTDDPADTSSQPPVHVDPAPDIRGDGPSDCSSICG